jgi:hypothetical protein
MSDTIIFDLHEDEWPAFECMGVPRQHYTVTGSSQGTQWSEIHIHSEWRDQFLVVAWLYDWNSGTFGKYRGSN